MNGWWHLLLMLRVHRFTYPSKGNDGINMCVLLNIDPCASYVIKHADGGLCIAPCRYGYRGRRVQIGAYNPCMALNGSSPLLASTKLTLALKISSSILSVRHFLTARFLSACKQSLLSITFNTLNPPSTISSLRRILISCIYARHEASVLL